MSTKTVEALAKHAAPAPPHILATFKGTFYKSVGGKGKEYVPWEKTVKVPLSAVSYKNHTPIGFFRRYKEAKLMTELGGAGIRTIELTKVDGSLPPNLSFQQELQWTADFDKLREIAERVGEKEYIHVDLMTDEKEKKYVTINVNMYPDPTKLRDAIKMILEEPEAFAREQKKLEDRDAAAPKNMEAEIASLADD